MHASIISVSMRHVRLKNYSSRFCLFWCLFIFRSYISMEEVLVVLVESVHNISVRFHHISLTQLSSTTGMKAKSCSLTPLPSQRPERIRGFDTRLGYYSTSASQLNEKLPFDPCLTYFTPTIAYRSL